MRLSEKFPPRFHTNPFNPEKIAEGANAKVYKGIYRDKQVAIKMLKGGISQDRDAQREFRKEFEILV